MVAYFLVLTMIWHDASAPNGPDFVIRRAVAEISEGAPMCEAVRDELRAKRGTRRYDHRRVHTGYHHNESVEYVLRLL